MLLQRTSESSANPWGPAPSGPVLIAAYRRGILRAKVTVSALTCTAARIDAMEVLKPGTVLWLTLPGLAAQAASVTASAGFSATVAFLQPLHPAVLDAVLDRAGPRLH